MSTPIYLIWFLSEPNTCLGTTKCYRNATRRDKTSNVNAGKDFFGGSLARKCMNIAPIIKTAIPIAEGLLTTGNQMPTINSTDSVILRNPMNFIKDPESP